MKNLLKVLMLIAVAMGLVGCSVHADNSSWFHLGITHGNSMRPTFQNPRLTFSVRTKNIKRGDFVTIDNTNDFIVNNCLKESDGSERFLKRVVAIPGDTVESIEGKIYINGEAYIKDTTGFKNGLKKSYKIVLDEDEYFVIGDNFAESYDSREWLTKTVPWENICKVVIY